MYVPQEPHAAGRLGDCETVTDLRGHRQQGHGSCSVRVGKGWGALNCCGAVSVSAPVKDFYELIRAKLTTVVGKQNPNGPRKCSGEWQFCSLFYTLKLKERVAFFVALPLSRAWAQSKLSNC